MDLAPTAEEALLRDEIRDVAAREPAVGVRQGPAAALRRPRRRGRVRPRVAGQARRAAGGSASAGREEYGGRGAGPVEHYIVTEELARARAPELVGRIGVNLVGPTLLAHGTPEQQARWLPEILDASEIWCQLFSEPGAGSDLASLTHAGRPRSTAAGCSTARRSGRATRSSPTGAGASRAPIPTRPRARASPRSSSTCTRPGVEVRPLRQITDESEFNEVFFSDVFVPDDRSSGRTHEGWRIANSTLTHERGVNPRQLVDPHRSSSTSCWRLALERGAFDDTALAPRLAEAFVEVRHVPAAQLALDLAHREGRRPRARVGSINKLWWSEMSKRLHDTAMAVRRAVAAAVARRRRQPRRRRLAAVVALLPGELDLGRHQRDPAQRHRRTDARPAPGSRR